ncbi:MAG TPA: M14 family zinc carboxypeptidase, partial [Xanthomonadales bacterium]|nr:M14 family zinc carboxypeptidase [Xanthomonadales bacterium]
MHTRDRALIQSLADAHGHLVIDRGKGTVAFDADAKERAALAARGVAFEVDPVATADFNAPFRAAKAGIPGFACYRSVAETKSRLDELATQYPALFSLVDAGDSWERTQSAGAGEDLRIARITNSAIAGPKPKLFVTASIHPRELPTAETAMRFVERLLTGYGTDPDATWIVDRHEVHVLVLTNPDGRKKAETGLSWRKNTNNNFCANSNTRGVDLNRNMAFQWGGAGASTTPCNETFRGPSALSEPEAFAVDAYQKLLFPDRRGPNLGDPAPVDTDGIYIDVHNNAAEVLWPYGFDTVSHAPNETALQTLGRRLAWFNGYEPMQSSQLYAAAGATDDNAYGNLGVAAYTIELGGSGFDVSCSVFESSIAQQNVDALTYAARVVRAPYLLPAGPDVRAATATPPLAFPGDPVRVAATADDTRFNQSNGTEATQAIASARAYVDVLPWVPASPSQPLAAADGAFNASSEAIAANVDTTGLAPGRHFVYLQARDAAGSDGPVSAVFVNVVDPATHGTLAGVVRNSSGAPVAAQVRANAYAAQSDAAGGYLHRLPPGSYAVDVTAPHHERLQVAGVPVVAGTTTAQDFTMYALCTRAAQDAQSGIGSWTTQVT